MIQVTSVINYVLDLLEVKGLMLEVQPYPEDDMMQPGSQMSHRDYVVREMVDTERKYVQDLENLQDLKKTLEERALFQEMLCTTFSLTSMPSWTANANS